MGILKTEKIKAILVGVDFGKSGFSASLEELALLARSAGVEPVQVVTGKSRCSLLCW